MHRISHLAALAAASSSLVFGQGLVREVVALGGIDGGSAIVSTGDVNGDGVDDLAIGSSGGLNSGGGFVTVVSGATGSGLYLPYLDAKSYSTGLTLANLGDVDGDGVPDLAAGDDTWGDLYARRGAVVVTQGGSGALLYLLEGEATHDLFGWSIDHVPDVDGDGVAELVVGAPGCEEGVWNSGAVYLYSGATQTLLWKQVGVEVEGALGYVVRGIEDLDGDGRGDVVASAPGDTSLTGEHAAGRTFILSGATGATIRVVGVGSADDSAGRTLDVVGDLDGDQLPDILVGAPFASEGFTSEGRVEVISSANGSVLRQFTGSAIGDQLGMHVAAAGDLDGDGTEDIAYAERPYGAVSGATLWKVVSGSSGQLLFSVLSVQYNTDRRPAAPVGDLNGDGIVEFAVGNPSTRRVRIYELGGDINGQVCYAEPHSSSTFGAQLEATSASQFTTSQNDVHIEVQGLPVSTGYFLVGTSVGSTPMAGGGRGTLCLGQSSLGRYANQVFFFDGLLFGTSVNLPVDNSAIPLNGGSVAAVPGDTFYFQYWFREALPSGVSSFNLSSAIAVTYQ